MDQPFDAATTVEHSSHEPDQRAALRIDSPLLDRVVQHLADWLPNEGCGLLASVPDGDTERAVHFFPGTNIDFSPVRYTMDPEEVISAMKRIRAESWQLAAIVHSHPRTEPVPSRTDLREWYYPQTRLLIVSFASGKPEFRCWQVDGSAHERMFHPALVVIEGR